MLTVGGAWENEMLKIGKSITSSQSFSPKMMIILHFLSPVFFLLLYVRMVCVCLYLYALYVFTCLWVHIYVHVEVQGWHWGFSSIILHCIP